MRETVRRVVGELADVVRLGQFISVGAAGALLDTATVVLLAAELGVPNWAAKLVGAELAIMLMFAINERWTFGEFGAAGLRALLGRFLRSNLVRAGGVLVATVVFVAVAGLEVGLPVGGEHLWLVVANAVGIGAGMFVNYVAESLITWRVTRE